LEEWVHRYVSSDSSVAVDGTPAPVGMQSSAFPAIAIEVIRRAALSATPWSLPALRRRLIVELAADQGWRDARVVAEAAGFSPRSARRLLAEASEAPMARAVRLCLADPRLLLPTALLRPVGPLSRWRIPPPEGVAAPALLG
jgi:hypothetical protein